MTTTITLNGTAGSQFLAHIHRMYADAMPSPLVDLLAASTSPAPDAEEPLARGSSTSIDPAGSALLVPAPVSHASVTVTVEPGIAEAVAAFVEEVLATGEVQVTAPPILFSPRPGDHVVIARDTLVEIEVAKKASRTWCSIARGTRGRLVTRKADLGRVFLMDGPHARQYAYVSDRSMTWVR